MLFFSWSTKLETRVVSRQCYTSEDEIVNIFWKLPIWNFQRPTFPGPLSWRTRVRKLARVIGCSLLGRCIFISFLADDYFDFSGNSFCTSSSALALTVSVVPLCLLHVLYGSGFIFTARHVICRRDRPMQSARILSQVNRRITVDNELRHCDVYLGDLFLHVLYLWTLNK